MNVTAIIVIHHPVNVRISLMRMEKRVYILEHLQVNSIHMNHV